jgi:pyruvate dehydrogenase E2 component (dihydrolipoamide acetyltransferase)
MPSFGQTTDEGRIVCWLKSEGDLVERGDVLAEVETDKATVPIEAFAAGYLRRILYPAFAVVAAGVPVALLSQTADEPIEPHDEMPLASNRVTITPPQHIQTPAPGSPRAGATAATPDGATVAAPVQRVLATPMAYRLATDLGVDIALIRGSGVGGRIVADDVRAQAGASTADLHDGQDMARPMRAIAEAAGDVVELSSVQELTGRRMLRSVQEAPQFALSIDVEMTEAARLRARRNATAGQKPSYTALLVRVVAAALHRHPSMNASYDDGRLRRLHGINIGVATATSRGLLVPVILNADRLSLDELHAAINALQAQAESGRLSPDALGSSTFTVSNLGMFGIDRFTAILNPPEAGILAVGRIIHRPVSVHTEIVSRLMMALTLTADHRAVDGAQAAVFLTAIRDMLENPYDLI